MGVKSKYIAMALLPYIAMAEDSWNREEVRKLLNESYLIGMYNANEDEEPIDHDEWMDKNL